MDAFVCIGPLIDEDQAARLRAAMLEVFSALEPEADPDDVIKLYPPESDRLQRLASRWLGDCLPLIRGLG